MLQIFQDSFREDNIGEECIFQAFIDPRIQNFGSYGATSGIYWIHYKPPVLSYLEVVTHSFSYVSLLRKLDFPLRCFLVNVFFLWICSHLLKKSSTESFILLAVLRIIEENVSSICEYIFLRVEHLHFAEVLYHGFTKHN